MLLFFVNLIFATFMIVLNPKLLTAHENWLSVDSHKWILSHHYEWVANGLSASSNWLERSILLRSVNKKSDTEYYSTTESNASAEPDSASKLKLLYRLQCDEHFYGNVCQTFCQPQSSIHGNYNCDSQTGSKICLQGWTGFNCDIGQFILRSSWFPPPCLLFFDRLRLFTSHQNLWVCCWYLTMNYRIKYKYVENEAYQPEALIYCCWSVVSCSPMFDKKEI